MSITMSINVNDEQIEVKHDKCNRCKCWRFPSQFLNDKGRKLKTCDKCRERQRNKKKNSQLSVKNQYKIKCFKLYDEMKTEHKNIDFTLELNETHQYDLIADCDDFNATTILKNNCDIVKLNRWIKDAISGVRGKGECTICQEKMKTSISCVNCYKFHCTNCYINLYKTGQGIIKCPFCRHEIGYKLPIEAVDEFVKIMKEKLKNT